MAEDRLRDRLILNSLPLDTQFPGTRIHLNNAFTPPGQGVGDTVGESSPPPRNLEIEIPTPREPERPPPGEERLERLKRGLVVRRPEVRYLRTVDYIPSTENEANINFWLRNWNMPNFIPWIYNQLTSAQVLSHAMTVVGPHMISSTYDSAMLRESNLNMNAVESLWASAIGEYLFQNGLEQNRNSLIPAALQKNNFVMYRPFIWRRRDNTTGQMMMRVTTGRAVNVIIDKADCSSNRRYDEIKEAVRRSIYLMRYSTYFKWVLDALRRTESALQGRGQTNGGNTRAYTTMMLESLLPSHMEINDKLYIFGLPIENHRDVSYQIFNYDTPDINSLTFDLMLKITHDERSGFGLSVIVSPTGDTPPPSQTFNPNEISDNPGTLRPPASIVRDAQADKACKDALISADLIASANAEYSERGLELAEAQVGAGVGAGPYSAEAMAGTRSGINATGSDEEWEGNILNRLRVVTAPVEDGEEVEDPAALIVTRDESYLMAPGGSYVRASSRSVNVSGIMFRNEAAIRQGQGQTSGQDIENPMRNILPASNVFTPIVPYIANIFLFIDLGLNVYNLGKFMYSVVQYFIARAKGIDEGAKDIPYNMIVRYEPGMEDELDVPDLGIGQSENVGEWEIDPNDPDRMRRTITIQTESYDDKVERVFGKSCAIKEEMVTSVRKEFEEQFPASITRCNIMGYDKWKDAREAQYKRYKNRLAREQARKTAVKEWYGGIPGGDPLIQMQDPAGGAIFDFSRETLISCTLSSEEKNRLRELYTRDPSIISKLENEGVFNIPDDIMGDTSRICASQVREYLTSLAGNCEISDDTTHVIARSLARGKQPKDITAAEIGLAETCDGAVKEKAREIATQYDLLQEEGEAGQAPDVPTWVRNLVRGE